MPTLGQPLFKVASRLGALPLLGALSPSANRVASSADLEGFLACQRLTQRGVREISGLIREGWTERQAADLLNTWLRDHGVRSFFHKSFVWYGERTRFSGVNRRNYFDYLPTDRVLRAGEVYILDVAPIFDGYICDIGYTAALGDHPDLEKALVFLDEMRAWIPELFSAAGSKGGAIWREISEKLAGASYDNIHALYPFGVLGHRVHRVRSQALELAFINFGWQAYWEFLSRGTFGQLLNGDYDGSLIGLWAIEPHVGGSDFGAKFEEILVVDEHGARWLDPLPLRS